MLSLRPYDNRRFVTEASVLAKSFGVSFYCRYQVFGEQDALLRIWLPSGSGPDFIRRARETLTGLETISLFQVGTIRDHWRFPNIAENDLTLAFDLAEVTVSNAQIGHEESITVLRSKHLIYEQVRFTESCHNIKAFIIISPLPSSVTAERQDMIYNEVVRLVERDPYLQPTIYTGWGFASILLKLVVTDFYHIGGLVGSLAEYLSPYGLSTYTFLVANEGYLEGDGIGEEAIRLKRIRDPRVHLLLPDLYSSSTLAAELQHSIESFVIDEVFVSNMKEEFLISLQAFLLGIIRNDRVAAYTAMFPVIMGTEQDLRNLLKDLSHSACVNLKELLESIDPDGRATKSQDTISLATILKALKKLFLNLGFNEMDVFVLLITQKLFKNYRIMPKYGLKS